MSKEITVIDLAKILGVTRQHVYSMARDDWGAKEIVTHVNGLVEAANEKRNRILERLDAHTEAQRTKKNWETLTNE